MRDVLLMISLSQLTGTPAEMNSWAGESSSLSTSKNTDTRAPAASTFSSQTQQSLHKVTDFAHIGMPDGAHAYRNGVTGLVAPSVAPSFKQPVPATADFARQMFAYNAPMAANGVPYANGIPNANGVPLNLATQLGIPGGTSVYSSDTKSVPVHVAPQSSILVNTGVQSSRTTSLSEAKACDAMSSFRWNGSKAENASREKGELTESWKDGDKIEAEYRAAALAALKRPQEGGDEVGRKRRRESLSRSSSRERRGVLRGDRGDAKWKSSSRDREGRNGREQERWRSSPGDRRRERSRSRDGRRARSNSRERLGRREKSRSRDWSHDRSREKRRDRSKSKDRSRRRERSSSYDRFLDRSRQDRSVSRDRSRRRERSLSHHRRRDGGGSTERSRESSRSRDRRKEQNQKRRERSDSR